MPAGPREVALGEHPCLVLRVSAGVLAAVALVAMALAVALFALGRASAGGKESRVAARPEGAAPEVPPPSPGERRASLPAAVTPERETAAPSPKPVTPVYTVQVATYGSGKASMAEELKTLLLSKGIPDVTVIQVGNQYRVCVGRFPSPDAEAVKLALERVQALGPDFRTAFVNRLR